MKLGWVDFPEMCHIIDDPQWAIVYLNTIYYRHQEIMIWLDEYCQSKVRVHGASFGFEDEHEAVMFKLVWQDTKATKTQY